MYSDDYNVYSLSIRHRGSMVQSYVTSYYNVRKVTSGASEIDLETFRTSSTRSSASLDYY
jgi:hypothetical protein